jgi:tetratricopeptide (TPR) repeat protein
LAAARDRERTAERGYFAVHPLLPFLLAPFLDRYYPPPRQAALALAFVAIANSVGFSASNEYASGAQRTLSIKWLRSEEQNFRHALALAEQHGLWDWIGGVLAGLRTLYSHLGRGPEWHALVEAAAKHVTDPATDGPIEAFVSVWDEVTSMRVSALRETGNLDQAEHLNRVLLALMPEDAPPETQAWRQFALAEILRDKGDAGCIEAFTTARDLFRADGDRHSTGIAEYNIGFAYHRQPGLRDLRAAMSHYQVALDLHDRADGLGWGRCLSQIVQVVTDVLEDGDLAQARDVLMSKLVLADDPEKVRMIPPGATVDATDRVVIMENRPKRGKRPTPPIPIPDELARVLCEQCIEKSMAVLRALPEDAAVDRGIVLLRLGRLYRHLGNAQPGLDAFVAAIQCYDETADRRGQGDARLQAALALRDLGRTDDALTYARWAEQRYAALGAAVAVRHADAVALVRGLTGQAD